jgi:DNA-binding NarL/FixJ family response regulator
MRPIREKSAVILDRHPLRLDAMNLLVARLGFDVVGCATDGDEAVALVGKHCPDVFVAGIDPGYAEQAAYVRRAKESHPALKSVVVAGNTDPQAIDAAFEAGANVYCVETAEQEDIASAIRQAIERSIYIATDDSSVSSPQPGPAEMEPVAHPLTRREMEILRLVAEGHSNSQLARMLWVTEQTVKFHLSNIYRKLGVANRTEASRWAQLNGFLPAHREHELDAVSATG